MKVHYPNIDQAQDILGWVSTYRNSYDLMVGETIEVPDLEALEIKSTYPFLVLSSEEAKQPAEDIKQPAKKDTRNDQENTQRIVIDFKSMSWEELKALARNLGFYKQNMKKEVIYELLEKGDYSDKKDNKK